MSSTKLGNNVQRYVEVVLADIKIYYDPSRKRCVYLMHKFCPY